MKLFSRNGAQLTGTSPASDTGARWLLPVGEENDEGCCCEGYNYALLWPCCCSCNLGSGCACVDRLVVDARILARYENGNPKRGPYKYGGKCWRFVTTIAVGAYPPWLDAVHSWGDGEGYFENATCSDTFPDDTGICPPCSEPTTCCNYVDFPPCNITTFGDARTCCVLGSTYGFANTFQEEIREVGIRPEDIRSRSDGTVAAPPEAELYFYRRSLQWRKEFGTGKPGCPIPDRSQDVYVFEVQETRLLYELEWTAVLPDGTIPPGAQLVRVNERLEQTADSGTIPGGTDNPPEELLRPVYLREQDPAPVGTYPPHISFEGPGSACSGTYITDFFSMRGGLAFHSEETINGTMAGCSSTNSAYSQQRFVLNSTEYFFPDRYQSQFQRRRSYVRLWGSSKTRSNNDGCDETVCPDDTLRPLVSSSGVLLNTSGGCSKCRRERGL